MYFFYFMCLSDLPAGMHVCHMHDRYLRAQKKILVGMNNQMGAGNLNGGSWTRSTNALNPGTMSQAALIVLDARIFRCF